MKRLSPFSVSLFAVALTASSSFAADGFQEHFMGEWDLNNDGEITVEEVTERRANIFASFDADESGYLEAEERALMNEMRETMHGDEGMHTKPGKKTGHGMQSGNAMGNEMGMGGQQMGRLQKTAEAGMHSGRMIDANSDGRFSRDEFVGMSQRWHARMDQNNDGVISGSDF